LARLGRAKPVVDRLAELARQADGEMVSARAAHAHALSSARPELLERCSATFEAIGANLFAAEAAADATVRWQKLGNARMATASARRADNLARRCDGAATPALQMIATGPRLTRAERKAAMLAAAGFANKELAAQLGVSIRTVESQLHSVYEKLGISGRSELSGALERNHISRDAEDGGPTVSEE
jgi:DNA-binding CsgD family transcriptional regulator